jgi:hypothetical protein
MSGISVSEDPTTHRILILGSENRRFNFTTSFRKIDGEPTKYNSTQNGFVVEEVHYPCGTIYIYTTRISNGDKKNFYSLTVAPSAKSRPVQKPAAAFPKPVAAAVAPAFPCYVPSVVECASPAAAIESPPPREKFEGACSDIPSIPAIPAIPAIVEDSNDDLLEQDDDFVHLQYLTKMGMNFEDAMDLIEKENAEREQQALEDRLEHERICRELGLPIEVDGFRPNIDAPVFVSRACVASM